MLGTGMTFKPLGPAWPLSSAKTCWILTATSSARAFSSRARPDVWLRIQSTSKDITTSTSCRRSAEGPRMRIMLPIFEARTVPERAMKPSSSSMTAAGLT